MQKLKVLVRYDRGYVSTPFPTAYIRLLRPLSHPINTGAFDVISGDSRNCRGVNIVLVERYWKPDISPLIAAEVVEQVRQAGACLIYTLDDNLLDLRKTTVEQKAAIGLFAREADGLIVSTAALKERFRELNSNIHIVANAIDERLFGPAIGRRRIAGKCDGRQVIGYMGTFSHDDDVMMIGEALRSVLRKRRDEVELQFISAVEKDSTLEAFRGLPVRTLSVDLGCSEYPQFVSWMIGNMFFDVGIAPLQDNAFNKCKSDIKFLDYSALGIPGIYSRIPIYQETVRHLETGYLAENTPKAWEEGLNRMLDDHPLRQSIAKNAQEYVFSMRTLEHRAQDWQNAIQSIWETYSAKKDKINSLSFHRQDRAIAMKKNFAPIRKISRILWSKTFFVLRSKLRKYWYLCQRFRYYSHTFGLRQALGRAWQYFIRLGASDISSPTPVSAPPKTTYTSDR